MNAFKCGLIPVSKILYSSNRVWHRAGSRDEPRFSPYNWGTVKYKNACQPRLSHHHLGWLNKLKWMRQVYSNGRMKFLAGENGDKPWGKNLPRPWFVHDETHIIWTWRRAHSPSFPSLHLRHISLSNPFVALPTSQLILQPFRRFTYVTVHSPTLSSLHLHYSSFSNPSVASPTSQIIIQPFRCFTYVTVHSPTLLSLLLRHRLFTYVTWRDPHVRFRH